jgi:putative redox protein
MTRQRSVELTRVDGSYELISSAGSAARFGDPAAGSLSPMDTVLAALAACTAMDVQAIAAKKRQRVEAYLVRVTAEQRDDHPRTYTRIDVTHDVAGRDLSVDAIRRAIQLSASKYCPVNAMLSAGPTEIHHHYVVRNVAPEPWHAAGEVAVTGPGLDPDTAAPPVESNGDVDPVERRRALVEAGARLPCRAHGRFSQGRRRYVARVPGSL